jgi:hypothetical protein
LFGLIGLVRPSDKAGESKLINDKLNFILNESSRLGTVGGGELISSKSLSESFWDKNPDSILDEVVGGDVGEASISIVGGGGGLVRGLERTTGTGWSGSILGTAGGGLDEELAILENESRLVLVAESCRLSISKVGGVMSSRVSS